MKLIQKINKILVVIKFIEINFKVLIVVGQGKKRWMICICRVIIIIIIRMLKMIKICVIRWGNRELKMK